MESSMTSFRLSKGDKNRFLLYDKEDIIVVNNHKDYFNKNTHKVWCVKGYECEQYEFKPINDKEIIQFEIVYNISNYFGDKSGLHWRRKRYYFVENKLYKENCGEVKKLTKELRGILKEFNII